MVCRAHYRPILSCAVILATRLATLYTHAYMTRTYFKTAKRRREAREDNEAWPGGPERRLYANLGGVGFKTGSIAKDLQERGLVEHSSAPIEEILHTRRKVYVGVDPTADSLHVGHLAWILLMKRLGEAGNALHFLVGGGTGLIGDPKEKGERPMLDARTVAANARALKKQLKGILGRTRFTMLDNADWLTSIKLIPFLRDIGKHFSVNELIKRDLIRNRLETPNESISYTEFTYSLLQGYDFLTLYKTRGVSLQIGGSDQWTNILSGVELIRKHLGKQAYALSIPLVMDAAGKKLGKSEGNAVWLNPKKTSPFAFYQYWMRLPDDTLERFLMVYTFIPIADIRALMVRHREAPHQRVHRHAHRALVFGECFGDQSHGGG